MSLRVYLLSCSMCNVTAFQLNCFNLVDTCNIALMLFLKSVVTKFRIPPCPLVTHCHTSSIPSVLPLTCEVIYGCPHSPVMSSDPPPPPTDFSMLQIHDTRNQSFFLYRNSAAILVPRLPLQISSYPNSSRCWLTIGPHGEVVCSKILYKNMVEIF